MPAAKGAHVLRSLGCRASVSKVLSVELEPKLSIRALASGSRSAGGRGPIRADVGLTIFPVMP
jgi:hypothetical protein